MEVVLSIVAGLGLRLFLASSTDEGNSNKLTTTLLGMWEGVVVHQVSGRSESPRFDHLLAYGLRLVIDLLVSKDVQKMIMVIFCSALAAAVSELMMPYAALRTELKNEREREKERRHKPARPNSFIPILSTPLPPRIRAYKPPEHLPVTSTPPPRPQELISSTPHFEPATPPSFWLQEPDASPIYSPATRPVQVSVMPEETSDALPVRPHSGVAVVLESDSPPPIPVPLPTPPDSAMSAVPSDGQLDNNNDTKNDPKSRFERHLYTIPEISSSEGGSPPADAEVQNQGPKTTASADSQPLHMSSTMNAPLPVPNADMRRLPSNNLRHWLTSTIDADAVFAHPFSPSNSPPGPAPLPVPIRIRQQDSSPQEPVPPQSPKVDEEAVAESVIAEDDGDMLRTPPASKGLLWNTTPDPDLDPLQTPKQLQQPTEEILSPLTLDVKSGLGSQSESSRDPTPARDEPQSATIEDLAIPGSLSQNTLLHPPLPPSGPLISRPIPPPESPPSPSMSSHSGLSDISVLSTRIPRQLYGRGEELRQKAREGEKMRAQIEEERRMAEAEGKRIEALQLKIKVRDLDYEAQKLHEKAARRYYAARNTVEISDKIDVHGLRPREAFDRIERTIIKASCEGKSIVRVIVGKGLHSVNRQPTLKPAVQREMQRLGLTCEVDPRNPGILNVSIPRSTS